MHFIAVIGSQCAGKTSAAKYIGEKFYSEPRFVKHAQPIYDVNDVVGVDKHRAFMQGFGDLAKKHFGDHVFLDIFRKLIKELDADDYHDALINDDTRFPFEMDLLKELGFFTLYIDADRDVRRERAKNLGLEFIENHNSEIYVPEIGKKADFYISDNGMSLTQLQMRISEIYWSVIEPKCRKMEDER